MSFEGSEIYFRFLRVEFLTRVVCQCCVLWLAHVSIVFMVTIELLQRVATISRKDVPRSVAGV